MIFRLSVIYLCNAANYTFITHPIIFFIFTLTHGLTRRFYAMSRLTAIKSESSQTVTEYHIIGTLWQLTAFKILINYDCGLHDFFVTLQTK